MDQSVSAGARSAAPQSTYGPQPDGTFHFRRMGVTNELYADIVALGGKLVERPATDTGAPVPYFKIPHETDAQRAAVAELTARWMDHAKQAFPDRVEGEQVRYVSAALRRLGGRPLIGPSGDLLAYNFPAPQSPREEIASKWGAAEDVAVWPDGHWARAENFAPDGSYPGRSDDFARVAFNDFERLMELGAYDAIGLDDHSSHALRYALAKHVVGVEPNPSLAAQLGVHTMTDRNVIFVRDELRKQFGTYYDRELKATVFLPDQTLDPQSAADAYRQAQDLVRAARERNPQEFDRLRVGLEIAIEAGLGPDVFNGETVNSLDDLVGLDYGRMEYHDAFRRAKSAYRDMVTQDPDRALVIGSEKAFSLDSAIAMAMGTRREEIGLDSVVNTSLEENRDKSRSVNSAAYQASDEIRTIAAELLSNSRSMDGRVTDAEQFAEQIQGLAEKYGAERVERYGVVKNSVSWGPIIARDGDLFAQLVVADDKSADIVIHDRAALVDIGITGKDHASASIGHALSNAVIDKAITDRNPVVLAAHGGVTFALSAGKLGLADRYGALSQAEMEKTFGAAAAHELKSLASRDYHALKTRAEKRQPAMVPPSYKLPANPSALDHAKAERQEQFRQSLIAENRATAAALQSSHEAVVAKARDALKTLERSYGNVGVRGAASSTPIIGEIVAVSADRTAIVVQELQAKTNERGYWVKENDAPVLDTPERPRLLVFDAREHVTPLTGAYPYVFMAGENKDGTKRDATPLTIGVAQGSLVMTKLLGPDMQRLVDMGHAWHSSRPAQQQSIDATVAAQSHVGARVSHFGDPMKPASMDSERESAIAKIEMNLRMQIAAESGHDLFATQQKLFAANPGATLKDAATSLGITVQRVELVSTSAATSYGPSESPDDLSWKQLQRDLDRGTPRNEGLGFDDFYGGSASLHVIDAKTTQVSGSVAVIDTDAHVMYVHQKQRSEGKPQRDQLFRIDFPLSQLPVKDAAHLDGTPRRQGVKVGDTVAITYAPRAGQLEPKVEIVNKELAREAAVERAEAAKAGRMAEHSADSALTAAVLEQKNRLFTDIAARALEGTTYAGKAMARGPVPTDDRAKNQGFLFPVRSGDHRLVVQVAQRGPGSAVEGFRVFEDVDLYAKVSQRDGRGKLPKLGMYAEIVIDDQRKPTVVNEMTRDEFAQYEADLALQEFERKRAEAEIPEEDRDFEAAVRRLR